MNNFRSQMHSVLPLYNHIKLFYGDHFNLNFAFVTTDMLGDIQIAVTHPTENKFAFHFIDLSLRENKQNLIQGNK